MNEHLIVQIICDKEAGTAFYVAPELLLTAWHTVAAYREDGSNVVKDAVDGDLPFTVEKVFEDADAAILKVEGRNATTSLSLLAHRIRIGEECQTFGYPDTSNRTGMRVNGQIIQKLYGSAGDFRMSTHDAGDGFDYQGMSGAPVFFEDKVTGVVIEQVGNSLTMVSIQKIEGLQNERILPIEKDANRTAVPDSIAKDVENSRPNYSVMHALDERLGEKNSQWVVLYGSPGSGKTTLSAGFESENKKTEVLGRFFFKVPNDDVSRAVRCSESYFADWLESVYINRTGADLEKLSYETKLKNIPQWIGILGAILKQEGKRGVLVIDGLDELVTESRNRVEDILSIMPETLPDSICIVLSCINKEILPASVVEKVTEDNYIEVTRLDMAACESYIQENSGEWEKPYSFIQAVATKTEGHPLYMNYLCRYISDTFDASTKERDLIEWVAGLPSIGGDIRSYYEAVWKKADPKGVVFEILALLSQTRGAVDESQLVGMLKNTNPYEFKSVTKEFAHLMKDKDTDEYEIYHSSFRLFVTSKLATIISYTNDQIADYCERHPELAYSTENRLHHTINGSDVKRGLAMCNQEWADLCAMNDMSPDLVMQDIKECLSKAVDNNLAIEVVRLMLLAQRIETRCDSIMVDNATLVADLKILTGKPDVALKYLVRDNILLVDIDKAISYLRCLFEMGYEDEAFILSNAIDAAIRKHINDMMGKKSSPYVFVLKGYLIVEGVLSGFEHPAHIVRYLDLLDRFIDDQNESSDQMKMAVMDMILAYQISNELRAGKKINIARRLEKMGVDWNERLLMFFIKVLAQYDQTESGLHVIGHNEAFADCLRQVEEVLASHAFNFAEEDLNVLPCALVDKNIRVDVVQKILKDYNPAPGSFDFRDDNGVDINAKTLQHFYNENLYLAYLDETLVCPPLNRDYFGDIGWEKYIEALVTRTAYISGTLYRKRAAGEDFQDIYALVSEVIDHIDFPFEYRVQWTRSYLLPEELLPFVYEKLAEIYCDFFEDRIQDFIEHLQSRMPAQLCMYREGYCATLIRIAGIFDSKERTREIALYLIGEAVKYIEYAVQNRGERCTYLLQLCREYAKLGEKASVDVVYQEVMNSSMGPDWYKEAQLEFINKFKNIDVAFDRNQIAHLAAIFEEASGEMTFQRYVRQQKNEFVSTIARTSSLSDAIAYYKFETLPTPDRIVKNAVEWKVDMPKEGEGYDLGCNHLIESSAVCQLLEECKETSPFVRYAISELFWENWDKMHNDHQYAALHAEILTSIEESQALKELVPRMAEYLVNEYLRDGKGDYLNDLDRSKAPRAMLDCLERKLNELGYNWRRTVKRQTQKEAEDQSRVKLSELPTSHAIMERCRKDIVSPMGSYWYSLSEFIGPLVSKADFNVNELLEVITGHYDINVRPTAEQFEKFTWFQGKHEESDKDEQLIHLLIWFLLHPEGKISSRALEAIKWLVKYDERVIDCLIDEVLVPSEIGLATQASAVLSDMANDSPEMVLSHIKKKDAEEKLMGVSLFSVSRNLYEMAKTFAKQCNYSELLVKMHTVIPESLPDRGDVWIDFEDKMFVEHKIDKLNDLRVTGRDFAKQYLEEVQEMKKNGAIGVLIRSGVYVRRSFHLDYCPNDSYNRVMGNLFDRILYGKVDRARAGRVYYAINN